MPTLYRLDADAAVIGRRFGARVGDDPWAGGLVTPGRFAPVVTAGREFIAGPRPAGLPLEARMIPRLWGVPPPRSAMADPAAPGILTVRNPDSPFWIGNLRNAEFRCLIPATGFMVWGAEGNGPRARHWLGLADQPLFAFAGVWVDSEVPSFAILTCEPNAALRALGREVMPVILPDDPATRQTWLHAGWDRASRLLQPYSSSLMGSG